MVGVSDYLDPAMVRPQFMLRRRARNLTLMILPQSFARCTVGKQNWQHLTSVSFGVMLSPQSKQIERWDTNLNFVHCASLWFMFRELI